MQNGHANAIPQSREITVGSELSETIQSSQVRLEPSGVLKAFSPAITGPIKHACGISWNSMEHLLILLDLLV